MLLRFEFSRMPHTSEMWNLSRGFEDLYYGILFASDDSYRSDTAWQSWVAMGVDLGIREAPPAAATADRIKNVTRSAGKIVDVTVERGREDIKDRVATIVESLVAAPEDIKALAAPERASKLSQQGATGEAFSLVTGALGRGDVLEREAKTLVAALERDVAAFSYPGLIRVTRDPR
jgi:hypothetical protein